MRHIVVAVALLAFAGSATSQTPGDLGVLPEPYSDHRQAVRFENMVVGDGLSQNTVAEVFQDSRGFMWFMTQNGVDVYDGYETRSYQPEAFDSTSISIGWSLSMSEAGDGTYWVATNGGGLNNLDRTTGTFTSYRHDPADSTSLASDYVYGTTEDRNGFTWVATDNGLSKFDPSSGTFRNFPLIPEEEGTEQDTTERAASYVYDVYVDSSDVVWAATHRGLFAIDPITGEEELYPLATNRSSVGFPGSGSTIREFPQDAGILWIGAVNGIIRFDKATRESEQFVFDATPEADPTWGVNAITQDPNNDAILWAGTNGNGLVRFDKRTGTFQLYSHDRADPNSLVYDFVMSLTTDRTGQIWVGTGTGLSRFSPTSLDFVNIEITAPEFGITDPMIVWAMIVDRSGYLWVSTRDQGTRSFLTRLDVQTGERKTWESLRRDNTSPGVGWILDLMLDDEGNLWASSVGTIARFDEATGAWHRQTWYPDKPPLASYYVAAMAVVPDKPNTFLFGSRGLFEFNTVTGEVREFEGSRIEDAWIPTLAYDHTGTAWVVDHQSGLVGIHPDGSHTLIEHNVRDTTSLASTGIQSIVERASEPGILWLASDMGIDRYDVSKGIVTRHYIADDGLPVNSVYALVEDDEGRLWYSTTNGIGRFDPSTGEFRNYGLDSGLRQLEYNGQSVAKGPDGTIYFGHIEGITAFHPERLRQSPIPPQVTLSGFKVNNEPLQLPLEKTEMISLSADQNVFSFDFVALHYANSKANEYAYRLDGWDKNWVDAGHSRTASYTNLPAGRYTFRVKAANADGVWSEDDVSIGIIIHPPWWRTWWAYASYFLLAGAVVFGLARLQRHRLGLRERERSRILEAQLKADAQAKRREAAESMSEIGRAITSTFSMREIIDTVYEHVNQLMDAEVFAVGVYEKNPPRIQFPASKERGITLPEYFHDATDMNRLSAICLQQRREIVIGDYQKERADYVSQHLPPVQGDSPASILYLPLIHHDKAIGVITAQSFSKHAYTDYHVSILRSLASYAAIALDNADAYRNLATTVDSLKSAQARLIQSEKLASLGEMTAGIAHEIKNPLNFVNNFAELNAELVDELVAELSSQLDGRNDLEGLLTDIRQNATQIAQHGKRADSIVRAMMQHASGGTGTRETVAVNLLVEEYLGLAYHGMRATDPDFNVTIERDFDEHAGTMSVVTQEIGRVLLNLLGNAFYVVNATSANNGHDYQPKVVIGTKRRDGVVELRITDNGPGIPDNLKERIFEPFFTTKPTGAGTGLGLSLSYDIVTGHGGTLKVESEPGNGATFIATLPAS